MKCCPENVYFSEDSDETPKVFFERLCISCGHCVSICPTEAISHSAFPEDSLHLFEKERLPAEEVLKLLKTRRSVRAFQNKSVEKEMLEKIIEGARYAPSAHNSQSTEFIVIWDREKLEAIVEITISYLSKIVGQLNNPITKNLLLKLSHDEIAGALELLPNFVRIVSEANKGEDSILHEAPALILFHGKRDAISAEANALVATQNAMLMAHSLGLGSFFTGYVMGACKRDKRIPELLSLPSNHRIYTGLAVGYPELEYRYWIERKPPAIKWM
ncbi:nitroreductase [Methanohalophilus levihalophilus]|nr:nitroreductase [Methanohalophilus levihalophilus]